MAQACQRRTRLLPQHRRGRRRAATRARRSDWRNNRPAARTSISKGQENNERKMERDPLKLPAKQVSERREEAALTVFRSAERRHVRPQTVNSAASSALPGLQGARQDPDASSVSCCQRLMTFRTIFSFEMKFGAKKIIFPPLFHFLFSFIIVNI